ncbi:MAG: 3-isopropylmalate dehydratase large subunit [Bacillota bacterium]|nr:3-isopropylmalate dehydratase large subunit [Bacillota bacterium]
MGMTMAQKILAAHAVEGAERAEPGAILRARPDVVLLNDVSGPLAFRQFREMGAQRVADPEAVAIVCDHFAPAPTLAAAQSLGELRRFAREQGIPHFFEVGQGGIEHSLLPERGLVAPGRLVVGGDSHTCTYGAFGAFGTGLGSTDIAATLALGYLWFMVPESSLFLFHGRRRPYVTGKDVVLRVLQEIGVDGATYQSMEFGGDGIEAMNMDERMAICNMAVEAGAKTGMVIPDQVTEEWARSRLPGPYRAVAPDPDARYAATYRFDLEEFGPLVARPHSPGNVAPLEEVAGTRVDQVYIGNCANGTLTDLRQAAAILGGRKVAPGTRAVVVPATQQIYRQALAEGLIDRFVEAGVAVSTPTCGACFGGHMGLLDDGEVAVATTNRNFRGRMGHAGARVYLANAYVAAAAAVAGEIVDPAEVAGPAAVA